jgi:MFS family permease
MAKQSSDPPAPARGTAAFQSRNFRRYQIARLLAIVGAEAQAVAVAWQVYQITHRALDLGYTGLALFLPSILFLLPAGHVADRYDRRHVVILCYSVQTFFSGALLWLSWHGVHSILPIYALLFGIGSGRAFSAPASQALLPHLVPRNLWVNAVTWGSTIFLIAKVTGPAVGGILFTLPLGNACSGPVAVYLFTMVTLLLFVGLLVSIDVKIGRSEHASLSLHTLLAGFRYMFHTKVLLGAASLDLFAVLLGGATALLPIYAQDILHAGPRGLGALRAAPAVGSLCVALYLAWRPAKRGAGVLMFTGAAIFGAATIVFGLSRSIPLSLAALFILGAADMASVVVRSSVIQLATPDSMRGRVGAVNSLFVGASNELGEFESGVTAHWFGTVRAVVLGGIGSLMVTGIWWMIFPELRDAGDLRSLTAQKPEPVSIGK